MNSNIEIELICRFTQFANEVSEFPHKYNLAIISSTDRGQYMTSLESHNKPHLPPPCTPPRNLYDEMIRDKVPIQLLHHQK